MEGSDILEELNNMSRDLKSLFTSHSANWFEKLLLGMTDEAEGKSLGPETLFELLCGFSLVERLASKVQDLRIIRGADSFYRHRFPYSPGKKENFSFFRFELADQTYDLCLGTQIEVENELDECPDISLQLRGELPDEADRAIGDVVRIWDAKYHEKGRFPKTDQAQFNLWCDVLELPEIAVGDPIARALPVPMRVNAVITNSPRKALNRGICLRKGFSIVFGFTGLQSQVKPWPSRHDQIVFRR